MPKITIYTDGSCKNNPGNGGWGAIFLYEKKNGEIIKKIISGNEKNTTNNRMELTAVIKALSILNKQCNVELFTDSKYVMEGATKWLNGWIKKNWKNSQKKTVLNQDLWEELIPLLNKHNINWHWVKGHDNNILNNEVDKIAQSQAEMLK